MLCDGEIIEWLDDRGYGFAESPTVKDRVFVHVNEFSRRGQRRPVVGDLILFQLQRDERGRGRATMIAFVGAPSPAIPIEPRDVVVATAVCSVFGAALAAAIYFDHLPWWTAVSYIVLGPASAWLYWQDKVAAEQRAWRVSERSLLLVDFFGGWIGGLFAQIVFRHKTRKLTFLAPFWAIVAAHLLLWLMWRSDFLAAI